MPNRRRGACSSRPAAPLVPGMLGTARSQAPPAVRSAKIKLSCNLYSFNQPLRSGEMTLEQAIDFCAELGFDAVDPTGYDFPGYPAPPSDAYVHALKRRAFLNGLGVSGTGVRNDFSVPDAAARAADLAHVKSWVEVAAKLGAPVLRVFDGRPRRRAPPASRLPHGWPRRSASAPPTATLRGVMIAYQNHDALPNTADLVLAPRERVRFSLVRPRASTSAACCTSDPVRRDRPARPVRLHLADQGAAVSPRRRGQDPPAPRVRHPQGRRLRGYAPLETLGEGDPREKLRRFIAEVREALA